MFDNYLSIMLASEPETVLSLKRVSKPEKNLVRKFDDDLEDYYSDKLLTDCPDVWPEFITQTDWYRQGGWSEVREAAYGPWQKQMNMQSDGTWETHVDAVKARFPKPANCKLNEG
ncbi:hypothetical protein [Maridesulfovibrio ferrireducens]|uniref:hypothetical protein n=1 Tax=Maridesulfovibrio ferrireducens TaxID=246191 RepID=UPI001A206B5F|nr:hypothetical protein [Maridesulfovibrio ferrireducens]MBI9112237.1 hypothetical protein [Maridesulfovibrio ferrireducens]